MYPEIVSFIRNIPTFTILPQYFEAGNIIIPNANIPLKFATILSIFSYPVYEIRKSEIANNNADKKIAHVGIIVVAD